MIEIDLIEAGNADFRLNQFSIGTFDTTYGDNNVDCIIALLNAFCYSQTEGLGLGLLFELASDARAYDWKALMEWRCTTPVNLLCVHVDIVCSGEALNNTEERARDDICRWLLKYLMPDAGPKPSRPRSTAWADTEHAGK